MTTALQIAEKAIEIADQNPDYVYVSPINPDDDYADCVYVHDGKGSCLFGRALMGLGVADADYLDQNKDFRIKPLFWKMTSDGLVDFTSDDRLLSEMTIAQMAQDNHETWADAVATLREYPGLVKA